MFLDLRNIKNGFVTHSLVNRCGVDHVINKAAIGDIAIIACKDEVIHSYLNTPFPKIQEEYKDKYLLRIYLLDSNQSCTQILFEDKESMDVFIKSLG